MIFSAFAAALNQATDPRFLSVLLRGVGLAVALLIGLGVALGFGVEMLIPGTVSVPWVGDISGGLGILALIGVIFGMLVASVFLMVPVAAAFSAIFLDEVAEAVEARHYPAALGRPLPLAEGLADSALFFAVMVVTSLLALGLSLFLGPLGPVLFWGVNGWLLGREYFQLAARRHLSRDQARALASRHSGKIWLAGTLMAAPLSLPLVGLVIPVLGAATFTHLFQRLRTI